MKQMNMSRASIHFSVSKKTLYNWIKAGKIIKLKRGFVDIDSVIIKGKVKRLEGNEQEEAHSQAKEA